MRQKRKFERELRRLIQLKRDRAIAVLLAEGLNFSQIARAFEISRERVRQIACSQDLLPDTSGLLTVREVAEKLGLCRDTVRKYVKAGKLKAKRLPWRYYTGKEEVEKLKVERKRQLLK